MSDTNKERESVVIDFSQVGTAGPFPVVNGRVQVPDVTMLDLARMLKPTSDALADPMPQSAGVTEAIDNLRAALNMREQIRTTDEVLPPGVLRDANDAIETAARAVLALAPGLSGWVSDELEEFLKAQDALDNHELNGQNGVDYFTLVRRRNAARKDLDAVLSTAPGIAPHQPQPDPDATQARCGLCHGLGAEHAQGCPAQPQPEPTSKGAMSLVRSLTMEVRKLNKALELGCGYLTEEQADEIAAAMPDASQQRETQEAAEPIPTGIHYGGQFDNFYDSATLAGMGTDFWLRWKHRRDEFPTAPQEAGKAVVPSGFCDEMINDGTVDRLGMEYEEAGKAETLLGYTLSDVHEAYSRGKADASKEAGKVEAVADEREAFDAAMKAAGYSHKYGARHQVFTGWRLARAISTQQHGSCLLSDEEIMDLWEDFKLPPGNTYERIAFARALLYLRPSQQALGEVPKPKVDDDFRPGNFPEGAGMWREK